MRGKTVAAVVIVGATALLLMVSRSATRADAATAGGCFSAEQGPSQPTLCQ
jgi:hypothetical protein